MNFKEMLKGFKTPLNEEVIEKNYYDMVNPKTGLRYDIPMLSPTQGDYYYKYIYYMKLREQSPATFEKIMEWA